MQVTVNSHPNNLEEILQRIFSNRRITRQDQHIMMSSLLSAEGLSEQNMQEINKVFDALKKGLIKVVVLTFGIVGVVLFLFCLVFL